MDQEGLCVVEELVDKTKSVLARLEQLALSPQALSSDGAAAKPKVRKRTRIREKKNKIIKNKTRDRTPDDCDEDEDPIDHRMQFVLELLRLNSDDWISHITSVAVTKGVIKEEISSSSSTSSSSKGRRYVWDTVRFGEANENTVSLLEKINSNNGSRKLSEATSKSFAAKGKRKRRFLNLDETINELISDPKFHVSLSPHKIHGERELDQKLLKFAEKLQKAGLGYITTGDLFVTQRGNVAFVRGDPEVVIRKQKLRRCALNGDVVQVFAFKETATGVRANVLSDSDEDDEEAAAAAIDEVKVVEELEELAQCSATGFVIRIEKKVHPRTCVGQFSGSPPATPKTSNLLFFPNERGIPPVHIPSKHLDPFIPKDVPAEEYFKGLSQRLFEVEISGCNSFYHVCNGTVLSCAGLRGNIRDENACILLRHGFKMRSMDRLTRLGETYAAKAAERLSDDPDRRDLTQMCIFTIDPATARDLDDAVSCRQLPNGNYEVGIHISDVTHYVQENTDLDSLVRDSKTTSVYMVDQVYHMLPTVLCMTCSLLPGQRKQAVSVLLEITPNAEVVEKTFTRSVINSCCQLSYEQAQKIIDDEDPLSVAPVTIYNEFKGSDLRTTIKSLHGLAKIMRERRMRRGALKFDKPKYYFKLDAQNNPLELFSEASKPANHLIEEFMILANEIVGEYIYETYPEWAILRQHSPPKLDQMAKVKTFFREQNFPELNYRTAQEINASIDAILKECDRRGLDRAGFELVMNGLLARPMNRAQYFCTGDDRYADRFDHFALSIPFYTHFTSPIRRYPDILVHRLLIRAIKGEAAPKAWQLDEINELMATCNRQKTNARYASEDSGRLFLTYFLRQQHPNGRTMTATVCNILKNSIEVKLWETGDELIIQFSEMEALGQLARTESGVTVVAPGEDADTPMLLRLEMFSTCRVNVTVDKERLKASLLLS